MVEKEMASTSEAIEDAVRRIEVRQSCRMGCLGLWGGSVHHSSTFLTGIQPFLWCFPTGDDEPGQERELWGEAGSE